MIADLENKAPVFVTKTMTVEGFLDARETEDDGAEAFIMTPVVQYHAPSSFDIEGVLEEIGVDLSSDDKLHDERGQYHMGVITRAFNRAKKAHATGGKCPYRYFKVTIEYQYSDDPNVDLETPWKFTGFEGHPSLRPEYLHEKPEGAISAISVS